MILVQFRMNRSPYRKHQTREKYGQDCLAIEWGLLYILLRSEFTDLGDPVVQRLGHRVFIPATGVRFPSGSPFLTAIFCTFQARKTLLTNRNDHRIFLVGLWDGPIGILGHTGVG